jgi:hypothetical protein
VQCAWIDDPDFPHALIGAAIERRIAAIPQVSEVSAPTVPLHQAGLPPMGFDEVVVTVPV